MEERIIKDINNLLTQLFQKMKEAGYEWDAEKKELKEIEQNMELTDFESTLFTAFSDAWQQYLGGEEVNVAQWAKEHSAELLEVARKENVEWSEEDEGFRNLLIAIMKVEHPEGMFVANDITPFCGTVSVHRVIDWLKSIKDRYTWKPSEEQMDALDDVISSRDIKYDVLSELWKDLKKLREE